MFTQQAPRPGESPALGQTRNRRHVGLGLVLRSLPWVLALSVVAAACGASTQASRPSRRAAATPAPSTTTLAPAPVVSNTPAPPPAEPCGGIEAIPAAVKASPLGGLNVVADQYDVVNIRVAASDPAWARFFEAPRPGPPFQGGHGLVHCDGAQWSVTDVGTAYVGCPPGPGPHPPAAVLSDLELACP